MVMSPYVKTILRSIRMTLPRFLAIFAIIALGVGFFAGLKVTTPSFVHTVNGYANEFARHRGTREKNELRGGRRLYR